MLPGFGIDYSDIFDYIDDFPFVLAVRFSMLCSYFLSACHGLPLYISSAF